MNTIIPNISKPYLLDEFLYSSNFTVHLFTNNIVGDESPINFNEPTFEEYSTVALDVNKWNVSTLEINYATCTYGEPIIFVNYGDNSSEQIYGYYVTNENEEILWYDKFSSPKTIEGKEALVIKLLVNLNKPLGGLILVSICLKSSDPNIPLTSSYITILTEDWHYNSVLGSLVDITNRSFSSSNHIFNFILKSDVVPSSENPYTFTYLIQSDGFSDLSTSSSITNSGVFVFEKILSPTTPPTTPPPDELPPNGSLITLYGPLDTKVGVTLSTATEDSSFTFAYLENSIFSFPTIMLIYINDTLAAHVDHFYLYKGKPFTLQYQSYIMNGFFNSEVYFYVDPPGPDFPDPG